jgi:hypothetical protein
MVQPHRVADDVGRKTVALVADCFGIHATQFGKSEFS